MNQGVDEGGGEAAVPAAWFYLETESKQNKGPVDAYVLAGLLDAGKITVDTLVWAEGLPNWTALKDSTELYGQVYYISASGAAVPYSEQPSASGVVQNAASVATELAATANGQGSSKRGAIAAAKPALVADPELAVFQAEMEALGEGEGVTAEGDARGERVETPPPEDQEFEDDDGTVYQWDPKLRKFQPKGEAAGPSAALPEYAVEEMTFVSEEEKVPAFQPPPAEGEEDEEEGGGLEAVADNGQPGSNSSAADASQAEPPQAGRAGKGKKRGAEEVFERIADKQKKAKLQAQQQQQWFDLKVNTSVYITGLPDDITEPQLAERFAQYGVLKPGEDGAPRVKLYRDKATNMPKGDGLVTFLYEPSVGLACKLADDDYFRPGMAQKMTVQPAKFEMHGTQYVPKKKGNKKKSTREKVKLAEKVLGWGGFDDKLKPTQITVVLKHLFHPNDFLEEPSLLKDLEADIKEECAKLGQVEKVRVFAGNPDGVVMVKFKTAEAAEACVQKMQGRFFGGRQVEAGMWDGYTNHNVKLQETPEQQAARLERFSREIEAQHLQEQLLQQQAAAEAAAAQPPSLAESGD